MLTFKITQITLLFIDIQISYTMIIYKKYVQHRNTVSGENVQYL